jgi:hypothetical protein
MIEPPSESGLGGRGRRLGSSTRVLARSAGRRAVVAPGRAARPLVSAGLASQGRPGLVLQVCAGGVLRTPEHAQARNGGSASCMIGEGLWPPLLLQPLGHELASERSGAAAGVGRQLTCRPPLAAYAEFHGSPVRAHPSSGPTIRDVPGGMLSAGGGRGGP